MRDEGLGQTCRNLKLFMGGLMAHTKRLNLNRGYMKLDVWKDSVDLFRMTYNTLDSKPRIDLRLRSQILDSTQSISSNIAEGYVAGRSTSTCSSSMWPSGRAANH